MIKILILTLLIVDHPTSSKRGGVCLYYKDYLPLIARNDLSIMQESFVTKISVNNENGFFTCLYTSPSQSHEELNIFCSNLDLLLSNINDNHSTCWILYMTLKQNVQNGVIGTTRLNVNWVTSQHQQATSN